ncbi:MAG: amino acid adenylation domain-containing protein [Acidobacteriota bacterium]|nr:amino acid adenylation domain-containing protein [Acidobacteriota bacterium]
MTHPASTPGASGPVRDEELLALLRREAAARPDDEAPMPRRADPARGPLSFAQQRLWFLDRLVPGTTAYHVPVAFRLRGPLSIPAFTRSLTAVVARHDVLRTRFPLEGDQPVQVVDPPRAIDPPVEDLSGLAPGAREEAVARVVAEESARPFDLARGPLLRVRLLRAAADEHVVVCMLHHIVCDGWSTDVLIREIGAQYEAAVHGRPGGLAPLPIQYGDFAAWQRDWLQGAVLDRQIAYWRRHLDGLPALDLSAGRTRPAVQTFAGASVPVAIEAGTTQRLRSLAAGSGATLFIAALTAFKLLLAREAGQTDIAVGSPIANRTRRELEPLIGFFVNTLVLRSRVPATRTFRALVAAERQVATEAFAHQDVPFEKLVEVLKPGRDMGRNPLAQVVFVLQPEPERRLELPGLSLTPIAPAAVVAKFDLTLSLSDGPRGLHGTFDYNTDILTEATVRRLAARFRRLVEAVVAEPDRPVAALSLVPDEDATDLRRLGAGTPLASPLPDVVALVEAAAARAPAATALASATGRLSYAALDAEANRLAHLLRGRGVGPESVVAITLDRSFAQVIAALAVLKAGGAYLPVDPAQPPRRLAAMIEDARARLVLTDRRLAALVRGSTAEVVELDVADVVAGLAAVPATRPDVDRDPDGLAYVIYTSGSSGEPKGVMIPHVALSSLVAWHNRAFGVTAADRATRLAGAAFDASVWELWPYLAAGAAVCLAEPDVVVSPAALRDWLLAEAVTIAFVPTPLAEAVLPLEWPASAPLRLLLTGGDRLHPFPSANRPFRVVNNYGPTEFAVVATSGPTADGLNRPLPSIGRPIDRAHVHLVDEWLNPVPPGTPGEIALGGPSLARGYFGRGDLTAARFVPDPFSTVPGARLYLTGDLGRWEADGDLAFIGRLDRQVKIRGFRVEPGAIEAVLRQIPGLADAVVEPRPAPAGGERLVAWVVPDASRPVAAHEVRASASSLLPDYMVPADVVLMDALPVTVNGKVDRQALPDPPAGRPAQAPTFVAPRTERERVLADIWAGLLGRADVGLFDNFFDLGGHSLLMVAVQAAIQERLGRDVPVVDLFAHPTVSALAAALDDRTAGAPPAAADAVQDRAARQRDALRRRREAAGRAGHEQP